MSEEAAKTGAAALAGSSAGSSRGNLYRIEVTQPPSPNSAVVRQSSAEYIVPFNQLSKKLQQLNSQGRKVTSVSPA
jgi:phycocyanin-associated rod linker protein